MAPVPHVAVRAAPGSSVVIRTLTWERGSCLTPRLPEGFGPNPNGGISAGVPARTRYVHHGLKH
jgi:hypothetical protein